MDVCHIADKFPGKSGGLKDMFEKGPQQRFFLVKFWVGVMEEGNKVKLDNWHNLSACVWVQSCVLCIQSRSDCAAQMYNGLFSYPRTSLWLGYHCYIVPSPPWQADLHSPLLDDQSAFYGVTSQ